MATDLLYDGLNAALLDVFSVAGQPFTWNGQPYDCILNAEAGTLVTAKSLFASSGFPQRRDVIRIANKNYQIKRIANATLEFDAGGMVEADGPFVNDPNNPSLAIAFDTFIGK